MGLFGISKRTAWTEFAQELGGEYIGGGWFQKSRVHYQYRQWEIIMDTFSEGDGEDSSPHTRLRALFRNPDGFYFKVYKRNLFSGIGKFFGMQDIQTGDPQFDHDFILKGNHEKRVAALFMDTRLKDLLYRTSHPKLAVHQKNWFMGKKQPAEMDQLWFSQPGLIKRKPQLHLFFQLFTTVLDNLVELGITDQPHSGPRTDPFGSKI